jgi:hypothetical protein
VLLIAAAIVLSACNNAESRVLTIWTDQSVVALYADYFNAAQDKIKAEVFYFDNVCEQLAETKPKMRPDIVIGNWLNSASTITAFKSIGSAGAGLGSLKSVFYPALLDAGLFKKSQVLLPVSFDIYAAEFSQNHGELLPDPFTINLDDMRTIGAAYNSMQKGVWSRIGFSPLWNEEFLFLATGLDGVNWHEDEPIAWDGERLDAASASLHDWIISANDSIQADDDFAFKYFFEPPDKLAASGRILFAFSRASDFFKLASDRLRTVDFRWIERDDKIIAAENIVYYGVCRGANGEASAVSVFTAWFFRASTQRYFLEQSKATRLNESVFGIAGGFSSVIEVTESVFPEFYPKLLGHTPPDEMIVSPGVFPPFFPEIKERVIMPYLREKIREDDAGKARSLELRLSDWVRTS